MAIARSPLSRTLLLASAALLVTGSVLPWMMAGPETLLGTSVDGTLTIISGVVIGAMAFVPPTNIVPGGVVFLLSGVSLWVAGDLLRILARSISPSFSPRVGLFTVTIGAIVGLVAGFQLLSTAWTRSRT